MKPIKKFTIIVAFNEKIEESEKRKTSLELKRRYVFFLKYHKMYKKVSIK